MSRAAGLALLALLAWHAADKPAELRWEMLYCCHLASALVALGFLTRRPAWVGAFGLFHLAVGLPGWLLDVAVAGTTTVSSALLHLGTSAAGLRATWRGETPRWAPLAAGGLVLVGFALGRLAPEALNVNVAWRPYHPSLPIPLWLSHLGNLGLAVGLSAGMQWMILAIARRPSSAAG